MILKLTEETTTPALDISSMAQINQKPSKFQNNCECPRFFFNGPRIKK